MAKSLSFYVTVATVPSVSSQDVVSVSSVSDLISRIALTDLLAPPLSVFLCTSIRLLAAKQKNYWPLTSINSYNLPHYFSTLCSDLDLGFSGVFLGLCLFFLYPSPFLLLLMLFLISFWWSVSLCDFALFYFPGTHLSQSFPPVPHPWPNIFLSFPPSWLAC